MRSNTLNYMKSSKGSTDSSIGSSIRKSFKGSIGDIVFGMEDGTVSVFGLVFGMALSVKEHDVLLAGIAGGAAGAISMMAGAYLDAKSEQQAKRRLQQELADENPDLLKENEQPIREALKEAEVAPDDMATVTGILSRYPKASAAFQEVFKGKEALYQSSPFVQSIWMLVADILASAVPIIPFFFFDMHVARIWSVVLTSVLLVVLGVGRSRITNSSVWKTVTETVVIAYAAALAGILLVHLFHISSA